MTIRELRQLLFAVDNQEMTVRELRSLLTECDEQDVAITADMLNVAVNR